MFRYALMLAALIASPAMILMASPAMAFPVDMTDPLARDIHVRAEAGDVEAMIDMSGFTAGAEAQAWLERAARTGDGEALVLLGQALADSDAGRSAALIRQAAQAGNGTAAFMMDYPVFDGPPAADPLPYPAPGDDSVEALRWDISQANRIAGDRERMANQAEIDRLQTAGYGAHITFERQMFEATLIAARQGGETQFGGAGTYYLTGWGVTPDPVQAEYWFRRAADAGNPQIVLDVARHYENGDFGPGRQAMARIYYHQGFVLLRGYAQDGSDYAQAQLGDLYATGKIDAPDADAQAVYWYTKAAKQGDPNAEIALGRMLIAGRGAAKNEAQGLYWLTRAATIGHMSGDVGYNRISDAQEMLGDFHFARRDYAKAMFWAELALRTRIPSNADDVMKRDAKLLDMALACQAHMTPAAIARVKAAEAAWLKAHPAAVED